MSVMSGGGIISELTGKDAVTACALAERIVAESRVSDCWYRYAGEFAALLRHKNSLVRNRALSILAANARWDSDGFYGTFIDELLTHITDEKPITARCCIKALSEIAAAQPGLAPRIRAALEGADTGGYRDSMRPLIEKDRENALHNIIYGRETDGRNDT